MSWLALVALALLHGLYRLVLIMKTLASRLRRNPRSLATKRSKTPSHLAICLVSNLVADETANEKYMLNSVEKVASWCRAIGIPRITIYDREGVLANNSLGIRGRLLPSVHEEEDAEDSPVECDITYPLPLTPPPSDDADSRPLSPHSRMAVPKLSVTTIRYPPNSNRLSRDISRTAVKRRRIVRNNERTEDSPLTLHIVSCKSGKPAIAAAVTTLLYDLKDNGNINFLTPANTGPSMQELNTILEGQFGLPSPDLMIVHRKPPAGQLRSPVELDGFPPWQMRVTEIYCDPYPATKLRWWKRRSAAHEMHSIEENEFRRALDEFADAEFRLGK